jgi:hypothetical protein
VSALSDVCRELQQVLAKVEGQCQVALESIGEFNDHVGSYLLVRLSRKLAILGYWTIELTKRLYEEHKGSGYVCVFLTEHNGITVHWIENEEIVADKAWFASHGSTVISVEKAIDTICQFINDLGSNNWVKVVEWLKTYGKSPGLDFSKFP